MNYAVKEIFYTLQGEGFHSGRAAVFCRFAGCNLWSGREKDRAHAICRFCDTDFVGVDGPGGGKFATPEALAEAVAAQWPEEPNPSATGERAVAAQWLEETNPPDTGGSAGSQRFVVCTGGEPLLQLDAPLIEAFHAQGFEIAVETNGTCKAPPGIDWICVSPKAHAELVLRSGDELKLVYPQADASPERYAHLDFHHFYLQPMDGPHAAQHTQQTLRYCMQHPQWKLSLQTHKLLGIP